MECVACISDIIAIDVANARQRYAEPYLVHDTVYDPTVITVFTQTHPEERRFYLHTGALTIILVLYGIFFDGHEEECFWSYEVRTTWFVE